MTSSTALQQIPCSPDQGGDPGAAGPQGLHRRSGSQVTEFLRDVVRPLLEQYGNENLTAELRV